MSDIFLQQMIEKYKLNFQKYISKTDDDPMVAVQFTKNIVCPDLIRYNDFDDNYEPNTYHVKSFLGQGDMKIKFGDYIGIDYPNQKRNKYSESFAISEEDLNRFCVLCNE